MNKIVTQFSLIFLLTVYQNQPAVSSQITEDPEKIIQLIRHNIPPHTFMAPESYLESASVSNTEVEHTLNLSGIRYEAQDFDLLIERLMTDPDRMEIHQLSLKNSSIDDKAAIKLASILNYLPYLTELNLEENPVTKLGITVLETMIEGRTQPLELKYDLVINKSSPSNL